MSSQALSNHEFEEAIVAVTDSLYALIGKLKSFKAKNNSWVSEATAESAQIQGKLSQLKKESTDSRLSELFKEMNQKLETSIEYLRDKVDKEKFSALWIELAASYEKILLTISARPNVAKGKLKHLKPINFFRSGFHVFNAALVVVLYQYFLSFQTSAIVLGSLLGLFTFLEITRRFSDRFNDYLIDKVFGLISRPKERHKVNSASYYLLALTIMVLLVPQAPFLIGVIALGIGDPMANIIGKKIGGLKIYKEKSLAGTLAFAVSAFIAIVICSLYVLDVSLATDQLLFMAASVSVAGAIIELFSNKFDDNFTLIVGCSSVAYLWFR